MGACRRVLLSLISSAWSSLGSVTHPNKRTFRVVAACLVVCFFVIASAIAGFKQRHAHATTEYGKGKAGIYGPSRRELTDEEVVEDILTDWISITSYELVWRNGKLVGLIPSWSPGVTMEVEFGIGQYGDLNLYGDAVKWKDVRRAIQVCEVMSASQMDSGRAREDGAEVERQVGLMAQSLEFGLRSRSCNQ